MFVRREKFNFNTDRLQVLKTCKGFTLVEMLMGFAIGAAGVLIFASAVLRSQSSGAFVETSAARNELAQSLRRAILDRRALLQTVQNNPVMKASLKPDWSIMSVQSQVTYEIDLYSSSGQILAGKSTHPVYYTTDGYPCPTLGVGKCFISATASFSVQGHPSYGSYDNVLPTTNYPVAWNLALQPEFMQINYSLSFAPGAPGIEMKPVNGSFFFDLHDLGLVIP